MFINNPKDACFKDLFKIISENLKKNFNIDLIYPPFEKKMSNIASNIFQKVCYINSSEYLNQMFSEKYEINTHENIPFLKAKKINAEILDYFQYKSTDKHLKNMIFEHGILWEDALKYYKEKIKRVFCDDYSWFAELFSGLNQELNELNIEINMNVYKFTEIIQ